MANPHRLYTNAVAVTPEEEEAWNSVEFAQALQNRNRAAMAAWEAAGQYVVTHAHRLGELSLRQAYERGFLDGHAHATKTSQTSQTSQGSQK